MQRIHLNSLFRLVYETKMLKEIEFAFEGNIF